MTARTILAAALAAAALPAVAAERDGRLFHDAIARGDYLAAERGLTAERRIFPARAEVLLNLAAVYGRTGRHAEAAALYRRVLAQRDVAMDLSGNRLAGAHDVARLGLARLGRVTTASR